MNIGDGLTIQVCKIGGKTTSGIFIQPESMEKKIAKAKKMQKYLPKKTNAFHLSCNPSSGIQKPKDPGCVKVNSAKKTKGLMQNIQNDKKVVKETDINSQATKEVTTGPTPSCSKSLVSKSADVTNSDEKLNKSKITRMKTTKLVPACNNKVKHDAGYKEKTASRAEEENVTLTQNQFNTILNLVKHKHDVDKGNKLKSDFTSEKPDQSMRNKTSSTINSPPLVSSLEFSKRRCDGNFLQDLTVVESEKSGKEQKGAYQYPTPDMKIIKTQQGDHRKDESMTVGIGDNSHSHHNIVGNVSMVTSFFLGEVPVQDNWKKRQEQIKWKEELDKQVREKNQKHKDEMCQNLLIIDDNGWTKHFDTMQLSTKRSNHMLDHNILSTSETQLMKDKPTNTGNISSVQATNESVSAMQTIGSNNPTYARAFSGPTKSVTSTENNHLRTMTSLLDPSQIDAIEVKRHKQQEQRRAIDAQMEEQRKIKKIAEELRKLEEEKEEKRLQEERKKILAQYEEEQNKLHEKEERRDRQTQELHRQMQKAQATALKEKFERRQNTLKSHGHDTTRLEQTHRFTLEKSALEPVQSSYYNISSVNEMQPYSDRQQISRVASTSPDLSHEHSVKENNHMPLSVVANPHDGAIKLEISLNQNPVATVAAAKHRQSKGQNSGGLFDFLSDEDDYDDEETEYLPLPQPSAHSTKNKLKMMETDKKTSANSRYLKLDVAEDNGQSERTWSKKSRRVKQRANNVPLSKPCASSKKKELKEQPKNIYCSRGHLFDHKIVTEIEKPLASKKNLSYEVLDSVQTSNQIPKENVAVFMQEKRSVSPPVPAVKRRLRDEQLFGSVPLYNLLRRRSETAMSVTTDQAKYKPTKHTADSPVPDSVDFVEYLRSDEVLDGSLHQDQLSISHEAKLKLESNHSKPNVQQEDHHTSSSQDTTSRDPLLNADFIRQRERQNRILKEISILRQGLLLKQQEVASYPADLVVSDKSICHGEVSKTKKE